MIKGKFEDLLAALTLFGTVTIAQVGDEFAVGLQSTGVASVSDDLTEAVWNALLRAIEAQAGA